MPIPTVNRDRLAGVHGVIAEARTPEIRAQLADLKLPVVTVTGAPFHDGLPSCIIDNPQVGRMAAEHFRELGLTEFAYGPNFEQPHIRQRRDSYAATVKAAGGRYHEVMPNTIGHYAKWLTGLPKPVGVFAASDLYALEFINACRHAGLMVPEQVAVLGVEDDRLLCRMAEPPLSSIDHNTVRLGHEAARLLDRLLAGEPPPTEPVVVPALEVVVRRSTDTLAIDRTDVAAAVRFIRRHYLEPIFTRDVVEHVPASRRTIENAFRITVGRTIGQEIRRLRIERAKHLLATTSLSMPELCIECGFSYPSKLSAVFKQETGLTPTMYRTRNRAR